MVVGFVLRNAESFQDMLDIVALTALIFTIFVFYYVQEWVFNNKDDIVLGDTPNREYWNYENVKQLF